MNKLVIVLLALAALAMGAGGCDALPLVSQSVPTPTATRTPRPTFTPRPRVNVVPTETEALEPTEEPSPTEEIEPTEEPEPETETPVPPTPRPTRRPVTQPPPPPTASPPPSFQVNASDKYICQQDDIFEVIVNAKRGRPGARSWAGGLWFGAFDGGGRLLQDGAGKNLVAQTADIDSISYGSNCKLEYDRTSPHASNGKLDVGDPVRQGTTNVVIRFIKSPTDFTPISPDYPITFGKGGRWWFYLEVK